MRIHATINEQTPRRTFREHLKDKRGFIVLIAGSMLLCCPTQRYRQANTTRATRSSFSGFIRLNGGFGSECW